MMPVHHDSCFGDLVDPVNHHIHYILKVPKELDLEKGTYFLPRGKWVGLMSTDLNSAKNSSHTAASYECGPRNRTGRLSYLSVARVSLEV